MKKHQTKLDELRELLRSAQRSEDAQARLVLFLYEQFYHYDWVGIFRLEGKNLVLGPYQGKTPTRYTTIPLGEGVCGAAAVTLKTEVVPDVDADARYLVCFEETRSEVAVPVIKGNRLWGLITVDSNQPNAFSPDDVAFLEAAARLLAERV
ncbi:MAG: GAF domain-containing protein [candidate division WOR-3 bacterium]